MTDVLGLSLAVLAVTVLLDDTIRRGGLVATAVWIVAAVSLAADHGAFPGIAFAIAAATAVLSIAILVVPLAPRFLGATRGAAGLAALVAVIVGALHG